MSAPKRFMLACAGTAGHINPALAIAGKLRETLPDIDCGSCGAPTCAAFAEDIVRGDACVDDCTVIMRMLFQKSIEMRKDASVTKRSDDDNKD